MAYITTPNHPNCRNTYEALFNSHETDADKMARELIDFMRVAGFDYDKDKHIWKKESLELSGELVATWKKDEKLQERIDRAIEDHKKEGNSMWKLKRMVNKAILMKKIKKNG